jgi:hypothetical protein
MGYGHFVSTRISDMWLWGIWMETSCTRKASVPSLTVACEEEDVPRDWVALFRFFCDGFFVTQHRAVLPNEKQE